MISHYDLCLILRITPVLFPEITFSQPMGFPFHLVITSVWPQTQVISPIPTLDLHLTWQCPLWPYQAQTLLFTEAHRRPENSHQAPLIKALHLHFLFNIKKKAKVITFLSLCTFPHTL